MYELNNLDIIILFVIAISSLIALNRGLIKEVLSIVGWVLATMSIIYLLPICLPFTKKFVSSGIVAGILTALCIFILFFIIWIYSTSAVIGKIRTSKLNGLDRLLGLFFGIMRAFLLVVLFNIMVNWIIPEDKQSEILTESKYFKLAGSFAKPIEDLIPEETIKLIKERTTNIDNGDKELSEEKNDETIELFEKLAQPKIKKTIQKSGEKEENIQGYKESERENLNRLIDTVK
ncbi:MAG: CvpA family protein [Alphaproteobacteria bacterium]|nr:CvpA family protein [Alphaproteobacteria bacterium]